MRHSRAIVRNFQQHAPLADSFCPQLDYSGLAVLFDGLPRVAHQIHQHLLEVTGISLHQRKGGIQINLDADFFGSKAEPLEIHGAVHDLIQGYQTPLRKRFPGVQKQLPEDATGALRFLINLAHFLGPPGQILTRQNALGVAENAGQRITQFMRDAAHQLSERGELLGLQEFRMESALGGQVAVDLHASQQTPDGVENGPRRSFENTRGWMRHLQLLAHAAFNSARQFTPLLREPFRFRRLILETADQFLQGLDFCGLLRRKSRNLLEPRIHRTDIVLSVGEDDSFFEPFDDVLQFNFGIACLSR